jgi:hypothetical protein
VLPDAGWEITYLGQTTYQVNMNSHNFDRMLARSPEMADQIKPLADRFRTIEPWLTNGLVYAPFWEVHATRVD